MSIIQPAAQLYTLREYTKTPGDIEKTLRRVRGMGFTCVQISAFGPCNPQWLADLVHELGLSVCVTHTPYERLVKELDAVIEEHRMLGCGVVGLGAMPGAFAEGADIPEVYNNFVREILPVAKAVKAAGLQFAYHNHNFEFMRVDGRTLMDRLIEDTDPELFHFILDTYWLQAGGVNPASFIRRVKGRMEVCHFKDMAIEGRQQVFAAVGEGNLDFMDMYGACVEAGVKAIAFEEDVCPRDPFDCLAASLRNYKVIAERYEREVK